MFAFIVAINVVGWLIFILYVLPHHFDYKGVGGSRGLGVGLGVAITAWFLGFRHAFDADHISYIDFTTRKLMANGKRVLLGDRLLFPSDTPPSSWRSASASPFAARRCSARRVNSNSAWMRRPAGAIGTHCCRGYFLYLIAVLNLIVLSGIFGVFRRCAAAPTTRPSSRPSCRRAV